MITPVHHAKPDFHCQTIVILINKKSWPVSLPIVHWSEDVYGAHQSFTIVQMILECIHVVAQDITGYNKLPDVHDRLVMLAINSAAICGIWSPKVPQLRPFSYIEFLNKTGPLPYLFHDSLLPPPITFT